MTHTSTFRRAVAEEAYTRTPAGGYPEVAKRHGLKPADVFAWVEEFYPSGPDPYDVVHIWMGSFGGSQDEFWAYFDEDEHDETDEVTCGFCADLGARYHVDPDLFYGELFEGDRPVEDLMADAFTRVEGDVDAALAAVRALGIERGNAIVSYGDPRLQVPTRPAFNGLRYIGVFDNRR